MFPSVLMWENVPLFIFYFLFECILVGHCNTLQKVSYSLQITNSVEFSWWFLWCLYGLEIKNVGLQQLNYFFEFISNGEIR